MEDLKITSGDYTNADVASMPDSPTSESWTAAQIKARMDNLVKNVVVTAFNALIDLLISTTAGEGASQVGIETISGVTGANVQAALEDLKSQIDAAVVGGLVEDSITDAYLVGTGDNIKPNFAAHIIDYLLHIGNAGTTGGTTAAYTATLSNFDATAIQFFVLIANATNQANATLALNGGTAYQIVTRTNSNVSAGHMNANGTYLMMWNPSTTKYVLLNPVSIDDHTHAQSSITNLTTDLAAKQSTITGAATTITSSNLTASRPLVSNSSGKVAVSDVTSTELGYLGGVTSAIQTQLDAKAPKSGTLTSGRAVITDSTGVAVSAVTSTELGYLGGVTSNVQTQLNARITGPVASGTIRYASSQPSMNVGDIWLKPID